MDPALRFALVVGGLFLAAVPVLWLAERRARPAPEGAPPRPSIWRQWWIEVALVALLVVPAWLGGPAWAALLALGYLVCAWELERTLGPGGLLLAQVYPGLGFLALLGLGWQAGFGWVAFLYASVELNDTAAYLAGRYLGGPKVWPRISPNKTWSGSIAGLLAGLGTALGLRFLVPELSPGQVAVLGLGLAPLVQAGDLFASWVKRRAGVKDFGRLVPTHGGLLDVWDSLLFCAPPLYAFARLTS